MIKVWKSIKTAYVVGVSGMTSRASNIPRTIIIINGSKPSIYGLEPRSPVIPTDHRGGSINGCKKTNECLVISCVSLGKLRINISTSIGIPSF